MDLPVTIYVKLKTDEKSDIISVSRDQGEIRFQDSKSHVYTFPRIFPGNISMQELYDTTTKPLLGLIKSGQSSSLLAYGHKSTGKKTTLFFHSEKGLFSSVIENLLEFSKEHENTKETTISVNIVDYFEENIHDLAYGIKHPQSFEVFSQSLEVKEHLGKASLPSATTIDIQSVPEAEEILNSALTFRTNYEIKTKEYSEKASTFVIIYLKQRSKGSTWNQVSTSTLLLACLASAERPKIRNSKEHYEHPAVHKSFGALSKVLANIKSPKIPWRDHLLTKILKIGLSDTPKVVILAHINPAKNCLQDSIHTLNFMEKCKLSQSSGQVEKMTEEEIDLQIQKLQEEKLELKNKLRKIESSQDHQVKKLCELMGITDDLDGIINETNEKELELIQTRKESYGKIEGGIKRNLELEKKIEENQALLERVKKVEYINQDFHLKKVIDLKDHLQRLKDELLTIQFNSKYYENEKVEAKSLELSKMVENSKALIEEKRNIVQRLPATLNPSTKPLNPEELKAQGKKEVFEIYKKRFEDQAKRHQEEIRVFELCKEQSTTEKKNILANMVSNFKQARNQKKIKIQDISKELLGMYDLLKNAKQTLQKILNGKFNQNLKEVFVPPEKIPKMPEKDEYPELFKLLKSEEKSSVHPIMQLKSKTIKENAAEDHLIELSGLEETEILDLIGRLKAKSAKMESEITEYEKKELDLEVKFQEIQDSYSSAKNDRDLYREMLSKEQKSITEAKFLIENQRKIIENIAGVPVKSPVRPFSQGISRPKK